MSCAHLFKEGRKKTNKNEKFVKTVLDRITWAPHKTDMQLVWYDNV